MLIRPHARRLLTDLNVGMPQLASTRSISSVALALALLGLAGCSLAQTYHKCGMSGCAGDVQITAKVQALLDRQPGVFGNDISVQTLDHVVYLHGIVDTDVQREEVVAAARSVAGVARVVESIAIRNDAGF